MSLVAASAKATAETATAATAKVSAAVASGGAALALAAGVAAGAALIATGVAATAHIQHQWADYREPAADVSAKSVKDFIRVLHPRRTQVMYELKSRNCNHIANSIFEFVTGTSSSPSQGSEDHGSVVTGTSSSPSQGSGDHGSNV